MQQQMLLHCFSGKLEAKLCQSMKLETLKVINLFSEIEALTRRDFDFVIIVIVLSLSLSVV